MKRANTTSEIPQAKKTRYNVSADTFVSKRPKHSYVIVSHRQNRYLTKFLIVLRNDKAQISPGKWTFPGGRVKGLASFTEAGYSHVKHQTGITDIHFTELQALGELEQDLEPEHKSKKRTLVQ